MVGVEPVAWDAVMKFKSEMPGRHARAVILRDQLSVDERGLTRIPLFLTLLSVIDNDRRLPLLIRRMGPSGAVVLIPTCSNGTTVGMRVEVAPP
jgi:hypothetical protein